MITVETKIVGLDAVRSDLVRLLDDLGPKATDQFLRRAGALAKSSLRKTLSVGGRPAWAPLAASTLERRRYVSSKKAHGSSYSHLYSRAAKEMQASIDKADAKQKAREAKGVSYSARLNMINRATIPLGGPRGTFAKSVRVKRLGGQQVYIGPPWSGRLGDRMDLYTLWKIHAEGSARLPRRRMDYLQPGDEERIVKIAEDVVDKALKIKSSKPMGAITGLLYSDVLGAAA